MRALLAITVSHARLEWKVALLPIAGGLVLQTIRGLGLVEISSEFKTAAAALGIALSLIVAALWDWTSWPPTCGLAVYSYRSATSGSTRVALRAGT